MRRLLAGLLTVVLLATLCAHAAGADGHIVARVEMQARLRQAADQRAGDLSTVRAVLTSEDGSWAASRVGVDRHILAEGVALLSDEELRDLAQRATVLQTDPVAGGAVKALIIIALIVLVVVVVLTVAIENSLCDALCIKS